MDSVSNNFICSTMKPEFIALHTKLSTSCLSLILSANHFDHNSKVIVVDDEKKEKDLLKAMKAELQDSIMEFPSQFKQMPSKRGRNKHHWYKNRRKKK